MAVNSSYEFNSRNHVTNKAQVCSPNGWAGNSTQAQTECVIKWSRVETRDLESRQCGLGLKSWCSRVATKGSRVMHLSLETGWSRVRSRVATRPATVVSSYAVFVLMMCDLESRQWGLDSQPLSRSEDVTNFLNCSLLIP